MPKRSFDESIDEEIGDKYSTKKMSFMTDDDVFERVVDRDLIESKQISLLSEHKSDITDMYLCSQFSDCVLRVDGQDIPVHRFLLHSRSQYFRALFSNNFKESQQNVIELIDVKVGPFKHIINYLYSGNLYLGSMNMDLIIDILHLSYCYCTQQLSERIIHYLKISLSVSNVWQIQKCAKLLSIPELIRSTNLFIDRNADIVLNDDEQDLQMSDLMEIFERDSFYVSDETQILRKVCLWFQRNQNYQKLSEINMFLLSIRINAIDKDSFRKVIDGFDLKHRLFIRVYNSLRKNKNSQTSRGCLFLNKNLATNEFNVKVTKGRRRKRMINSSNRWYTTSMQSTCHTIEIGKESDIQITLSKPFIINHIVLLLYDIGKHSYNYRIEVSIDRKNWQTVVDHREYLCRSYQYIFFEAQTVQHIRIVGHKSVYISDGYVFNEFHVMHFQCMYCTIPVKIIDQFIAPNVNVLKPLTSIFSETMRKYLNSSCYTKTVNSNGKEITIDCIPFEKGSIGWFSDNCYYFQLCQPFIIDSIALKFVFPEGDKTPNMINIEKSFDFNEWTEICFTNFSNHKKTIDLNNELILFIRISSKTTKLFPSTLVLFECPFNSSVESTNQFIVSNDGDILLT